MNERMNEAWMNHTVGGRSGDERKSGSGGHRPRARQDSSSSRPSALGLFQKDSEKGISVQTPGPSQACGCG